MAWRYLAQRLDGTGPNGEIFDADLPLSGVSITDVISGPLRIEGTISPGFPRLIGSDGQPLMTEWGTAIYAERDGEIRSGAILSSGSYSGPEARLDCTGWTGYPYGMPYTGAWFGVEIDPTDVLREVWRHLQSFPDGNLGLTIDPLMTGVKIGTELEQVEFDTEAGPVSFEAGPVKLADYLDQDMGRFIEDLVRATPFDFHEEHFWADASQDTITHYLRLGYPRIGTRRTDLRFVLGENIWQVPDVDRDGEAYASGVVILGAGEGRDMLRAKYEQPSGRLRRITTVTDKEIQSLAAINARASREYLARAGFASISQIAVRESSHAGIGSWSVGDEILIESETDWISVRQWSRIISSTIQPDNSELAVLTVLRAEAAT